MPSIWRGLEAHKYILNGHLLSSVYVFLLFAALISLRCLLFPFSLLVGFLQDFRYILFSCWGDECFMKSSVVSGKVSATPGPSMQMKTQCVFLLWVPALFCTKVQGSCKPATKECSVGARSSEGKNLHRGLKIHRSGLQTFNGNVES